MPGGRNRAFGLLLFGSSVSMLGSRVTTIAYPMLVLYLTGSPLTAGWVAFAVTAPSVVVYAPAGVLVDRWDPRRAILLSEFGRGAGVATIAVTLALGRPSVFLLVAAGIIESVLEAFSTLAERCYVRSVVEPDQTPSALARMEARSHFVVLAGRPLGGFLFGLGPILPFLADALSFVVSVSAIFSIKKKHLIWQVVTLKCRDFKANVHPGWISEMRLGNGIQDAAHWLRKESAVRQMFIISTYATLIFQALIMLFLANAHARGLRPITIGIVLAASGAGGAVGSIATTWLRTRAGLPWIKLQAWSWAAVFAVLAISGGRSFILMTAMMAILGFAGALGNIELNTYLIRGVGEGMVARVTSILRTMTFGACAVGSALGGILAQNDARYAMTVLSAMTIVLLALAVLSPTAAGPSSGTVAPCPPQNPSEPVPEGRVAVGQAG